MHHSVRKYIRQEIREFNLVSMDILEVGSRDINGHLLRELGKGRHIGIDLHNGKNVDIVMDAGKMPKRWTGFFDLVVTCEMLEHCFWWQLAIQEMKRVTKPGGTILITTRSKGFKKHDYPEDWWRFRHIDFFRAFEDCEETTIVSDPQFAGVFVRVKK